MWRPSALLISLIVLLAGCSGSNNAVKVTSPPSSATQAGSTAGTATAAARAGTAPASSAATTAAARQPAGTLRVGVPFLPATLDPTKDGFNLISYGAAETLVRLSREQKPEPWLAESVKNVDPTTWRVTLRKNAVFWDGTPVNADAVIAAFKADWAAQPAADGFISKETQLSAIDTATVEFKTPAPSGAFMNNLASFQFVVFKPGPNGALMTGPYQPTKLDVDQQLLADAFVKHWGGPPPLAKLELRLVKDPQARALALQSGDIDLLQGLPPELVQGLAGDIERAVTPSTRVDYVMLNTARLPFSDQTVRAGAAFGIDRAALNTVGLNGVGAPATNLFPPLPGIEVVSAQTTDVNQAKQALDAAGWKPGGDGVRAKDGKRLALTLLSYPNRPELTPMATAIQSQLKPLGFDIQVQQVPDITATIKDGNFDATMYSINTLPTGDPLYLLNLGYTKGGSFNYGGYSSTQMDGVVAQLRVEADPAKRQALSRQAQEVIKADVPNLYLVASPLVYAYKKGKVKGFMPHPNDLYFIDTSITIQ